jgi:hypothetical protein
LLLLVAVVAVAVRRFVARAASEQQICDPVREDLLLLLLPKSAVAVAVAVAARFVARHERMRLLSCDAAWCGVYTV